MHLIRRSYFEAICEHWWFRLFSSMYRTKDMKYAYHNKVFINKSAQKEEKQITIQIEMFIFRSTAFQLNDRNGIKL